MNLSVTHIVIIAICAYAFILVCVIGWKISTRSKRAYIAAQRQGIRIETHRFGLQVNAVSHDPCVIPLKFVGDSSRPYLLIVNPDGSTGEGAYPNTLREFAKQHWG